MGHKTNISAKYNMIFELAKDGELEELLATYIEDIGPITT